MKTKTFILGGFIALSAISLLCGCKKEYNFEGTEYNRNIKTLVWADEFDKDGAPNPENWIYEVGYVRNKEAQFYTFNDRKNVRVENGMLVIEAHKDSSAKNPITSGSIKTVGKREFLHGRIEARAKIPSGRGTWPAIWTVGVPLKEGDGWPKNGEIDIMEYVGYNPKVMTANVHTYGSVRLKTDKVKNGFQKEIADLDTEWHTYALEWTKDELKFFIDGKQFGSYPRPANANYWAFDNPHFMIVNLAIGGAWGGNKGIDDAIFPAKFLVDYIRYYR